MTTAISDAGFQFSNGSILSAAPRSYLSGLTLSTAGASNTMSIAAGMGMDSTNARSIVLTSAFSKTTGAWAVGTGNGGLDTGTIANSTWYYYYLITNPITGVVDVIFSLSSTSPTLPSGYTLFRYIGAGFTNGSAQWTGFIQIGDDFYWTTPVLDFASTGSLTATLLTCSVPRGRRVKAYFNMQTQPGAGIMMIYLSSPDVSDQAPSQTVSPIASLLTLNGGCQAQCYVNTSAQIRHRESQAANMWIATLGWADLRGKDL